LFYSFIVSRDVPFCLPLVLSKNRAMNRDMNCAHLAYLTPAKNPALNMCVCVLMFSWKDDIVLQ
jgi:hypothetical protein